MTPPVRPFRMRPFAGLLLMGYAAALSAAAADSAEPFKLTEDFSGYAEGSTGEPRWDALHVGFSVNGQSLLASVPNDRGFAVLQAAPVGRSLTMEASVTPIGPQGKQWRTGGIGLFLDADHYWHLALVEEPDGKRRFAELSEMLDGQWNAHTLPGTALTTIEERGLSGWQYGHAYRLRLSLSRDRAGNRITGEIFDGDEVIYRCVRGLGGPAVDRGQPMLTAGSLAVRFDDVRVSVGGFVPKAAVESPAFPPFEPTLAGKGFKHQPTGFFRVEAAGPIWWLVDPAGGRTLSLGTDHVRYDGHWCEALGYAPYGRNVARKYGNADAWAAEATRRLRGWNFNVLGAGSSAQARHRGLAHTEFLSFGADFSGIAALVEKTTWTGWPDVFDPRFERFCELRARQRCAPNKTDPWLLGYFLDNELEWWGKNHRPWGIAEEAWKLPASAAGKQALIASLRRTFKNDAPAFNASFGTRLANLDELPALAELPQPLTESAKEALAAFVADAAARYFQITTAAVRRHDPNHLIIGCRFAHDAPESAWRQAGATCDVVTVNMYPRLDLERGRVLGLAEHLRSRFELCQKPIILTEWSFPALDAKDTTGRPLPSLHGAGMRVDTQAQRARCYALMQRALFTLPFVVGSHYFMWCDEPALGISSTFPEDSNYGLVSEIDEPYPEITATAAQVNRLMAALHAGELKMADIPDSAIGLPAATALQPEPGTVTCSRNENGFVIENGALRVEHVTHTGAAFERIFSRAKGGAWFELGRYQAALFVVNDGQNVWPTATRIMAVEVREQTPQRLVLEMQFAHEAAPAWQAAYRFTFEPGRPWFLAQALWVKNAGDAPWLLRGYYHYLPPRLGGNADDDEPGGPRVPNYYLPVATWKEPQSPWHFGLLAPRMDDERLMLQFWKENGAAHPDGWRKLDIELAPGARWTAADDEPIVAVFGLRETTESPRPWLNLSRTLQ